MLLAMVGGMVIGNFLVNPIPPARRPMVKEDNDES
jgi:hypothetical protein